MERHVNNCICTSPEPLCDGIGVTGEAMTGLGSGFLTIGEGTGSAWMEMVGVDTGMAAGALAVFVTRGVIGVDGTADGGAPAEIAPVSRFTRFGGATFPEKNSPAERAGSEEGAGG